MGAFLLEFFLHFGVFYKNDFFFVLFIIHNYKTRPKIFKIEPYKIKPYRDNCIFTNIASFFFWNFPIYIHYIIIIFIFDNFLKYKNFFWDCQIFWKIKKTWVKRVTSNVELSYLDKKDSILSKYEPEVASIAFSKVIDFVIV